MNGETKVIGATKVNGARKVNNANKINGETNFNGATKVNDQPESTPGNRKRYQHQPKYVNTAISATNNRGRVVDDTLHHRQLLCAQLLSPANVGDGHVDYNWFSFIAEGSICHGIVPLLCHGLPRPIVGVCIHFVMCFPGVLPSPALPDILTDITIPSQMFSQFISLWCQIYCFSLCNHRKIIFRSWQQFVVRNILQIHFNHDCH